MPDLLLTMKVVTGIEIKPAPHPCVERASLFLGGDMSNVYDAQGNLVNAPGPGCGRYTDSNSTEIDWFATHPRPVEKEKVEFHAPAVPATLPPNSGETLTVVAPVEPTTPVAE